MTMKSLWWTCLGNVRGQCGVRHRTQDTASAHCDQDDRDVRRGHGRLAYSDRRPTQAERGSDGEWYPLVQGR